MSKRARGSGGVEFTGVHWRYYAPNGSGGTFRSPSIYATERLAVEALATFRQRVLNRELVHVKGRTLIEYFEQTWWPRRLRLKARSTNAADLSRWNSRLSRATFAGKPMAHLTKAMVREWADGLNINRPDKYLALLNNILNGAVEDEALTANPAVNVSVEVVLPDVDERYPIPEEQRAILLCESIPLDVRLIFAFALATGLRPGEWRSLRIVDLSLNTRVPFVRVRFGSLHGKTKTRKSRNVPLLGMALTAARAWMAGLPQYAPHNPHGLLFPTRSGAQRLASAPFGRVPRAIDRHRHHIWHDYVKAAGIGRRLVPYSFRHGAATNMLTGSNVDQQDAWKVQVMLGHARLSTTENYLHHGERELFASLGANSSVTPPDGGSSFMEEPISQAFERVIQGVDTWPAAPDTKPPEGLKDRNHGDPDFRWSQSAAIEHFGQLVTERRESDPVERAFARLHGRHWKAALADLISLTSVTQSAASKKGGAR